MLNGGACASAWYGEVLNQTPNIAIDTEMGSGKFPEAGMFNAAYVRDPKYYDLSWFVGELKDDLSMGPYEPLCYGRAPLWGGILFLGGPGGKSSSCKWP
jgi:hypothetical protein